MPPSGSPARLNTRREARLQDARDLLAAVRVHGTASRYSVAIRLARRAVRILENFPEQTELRALLLTNLGSFTAALGHVDEGLRLVDQAAQIDPRHTPVAYSTKGLILERTRQFDGALEALDVSLAYRPLPDDRTRCTAFIRRGLINISLGRLADATKDFVAAESLSDSPELAVLAFMARHNLGWVLFLRGDLPGALAAMEAAARVDAEIPSAEPSLDRARVLMAAGLLGESREFAERALQEFSVEKAPSEMVEALLVVTQLDVLSGNPEAAEKSAGKAVSVSGRHRLHNLVLICKLESLRAHSAVPPPRRAPRGPAASASATRALAESLAAAGLTQDAASAHLLEAEALVESRKFTEARDALLRAAALVPSPQVSGRLHSRLIAGRIALAEGQQSSGLSELRKGLDDLADFQARFGSQDMQAGASLHGRELAKLGLRTAIDSGSPAAILQWLERGRAAATRLAAVNPPADPELAEALGALRFATRMARQAALAGKRDNALDRRVADLRRQVRSRSWIVAGTGTVQRPLSLAAVQRLLAADPTDPTVIAYITGQSAVRALVITARRASYRTLGDWDDDAPRHRRRVADLNMLAASRVPARIRAVARASVLREFERLSAELIEPIADRLRAGPVIIAATGELATAPWNLLPGLAGRAVSVSSSVTASMAAGGRPARAHLRGVLAVAGPDVENGATEARSVAGLHSGAGLLTDDAAIGEAVLAQIPAGGLLHVAAHGHHETESPLFSSVMLADGPLYGYDIAPNPYLPDQVVLSSCDVGRSDVRPGGEPLGLAAALLRSGVSTVVAGVCRISDSVAAAVMLAYHEALLAGDTPAGALATATASVDGELAPFNCFGAGM